MTDATADKVEPAPVSIGKQSSQFQPGNNANPSGRPKGSRNKASQLLDQLGRENAKDILQNIIDRAKDGDNYAANLVLNRIWPARKSNPVQIELPAIETAADIAKALNVVLASLANGELDPDEAEQISGVIESKRKAMETLELEQRIAALEKKSP